MMGRLFVRGSADYFKIQPVILFLSLISVSFRRRTDEKCQFSLFSLCFYVSYRSRSKEKDTMDPLSEKKKIKEEKEDEKVEDVSEVFF